MKNCPTQRLSRLILICPTQTVPELAMDRPWSVLTDLALDDRIYISMKIYGIYESDRFVCVLLHVQIPDLSECSKVPKFPNRFVLVFILKMHIL